MYGIDFRIFQKASRVGGMETFAGSIFLLGGGDLWRSDFDHSNLFQSLEHNIL